MKEKTLNKTKLKLVLKWVVIVLLTCFAYAFSLYQNGFEKTNQKLLTLLICALIGFLLFYLVYLVVNLICIASERRKIKKALLKTINCDEQIAKTISNQKYLFNYNVKISAKENFSSALSIITTLVGDVSHKFGKKGKYALLNFSVYDALDFVENCIDGVEGRVDALLKNIEFTGVRNKPLPFIENALNKMIDSELNGESENAVEEKVSKFSEFSKKVSNKVKSIGGKVVTYTFSGVIENTVNDVIRFIGAESFRVFSKYSEPTADEISQSLERELKEI